MENDAGGAPERETLAGSQERTDERMTDFGSQLSSCLWCPREGADASMFLGERDEGFTAVSEDGARSSENLWQVGKGRGSPEIKLCLSKGIVPTGCSSTLRDGVAWRKEHGLQNQSVLTSHMGFAFPLYLTVPVCEMVITLTQLPEGALATGTNVCKASDWCVEPQIEGLRIISHF